MRLKKMKLMNFKGLRDLTIDFNGKDISIYGDNATGKTTVFDAFVWCLFDKDSLNRKDFNIKTLDESGEAIHMLEHEVELEFVDGLKLRKVYFEKWTRQRGESDKSFTGHTVDYFVNDVPSKKAEYTRVIGDVIQEDVFKLLSNPLYFNMQLHWQERLKTLYKVCGNVDNEEVYAFSEQLRELESILGNRDIEDHKKMIAAKLKEINQELERIPVRVDEVNKSIADTKELNKDDLTAALEGLKIRKRDLESEIAMLESGGKGAVIKKQILETENEINSIVNKTRQSEADAKIQLQKQYTEAAKKESNKMVEVRNMESVIQQTRIKINTLNEKLKTLAADFTSKNAAQANVAGTCPACEQSLPESQVEDAIKKFNAQKAAELTRINDEGKATKSELENLQKSFSDMESRYNVVQEELAQLAKDTEIINNTDVVAPSPETDANYCALQAKLQKLKDTPYEDNAEAKVEIRTKLQVIEGDMFQINQSLAQITEAEKSERRIEELQKQERDLSAEHRQYSKEQYLCEEFFRTKANLLTDRINGKFKLAQFKLFEQQINGGLTECCEVMHNGVPYSDLNNAMRIQVGCDIIDTLQKHYGVSVPVWIDNRESVTRLDDFDFQIISLIVSEKDKMLRVESQSPGVRVA